MGRPVPKTRLQYTSNFTLAVSPKTYCKTNEAGLTSISTPQIASVPKIRICPRLKADWVSSLFCLTDFTLPEPFSLSEGLYPSFVFWSLDSCHLAALQNMMAKISVPQTKSSVKTAGNDRSPMKLSRLGACSNTWTPLSTDLAWNWRVSSIWPESTISSVVATVVTRASPVWRFCSSIGIG